MNDQVTAPEQPVHVEPDVDAGLEAEVAGDGEGVGQEQEQEQEQELSGVDLARVALQMARESARRRGVEPAAKRKAKARQGAGSRRDGRDPVGLGGALTGLIASRAWEVPVAGGSVLADWPAIAPELAAHVTAVAHDPETGRLDLLPLSPTWATQLRLTSASLIARIDRHAGDGVVRTIRVLPPGAASASVQAQTTVVATAALPVVAEPREHSAGYRLALEAARSTKNTDGTAKPLVRAAIERQNRALAARREPEAAFTPALDEQLREEAERRRNNDVQRKAVLRARQERAARDLSNITPASRHAPTLGKTA